MHDPEALRIARSVAAKFVQPRALPDRDEAAPDDLPPLEAYLADCDLEAEAERDADSIMLNGHRTPPGPSRENPRGTERQAQLGKPRFVPVALDDIVLSATPPWLVDGLLPARGLAFIVGPPKSGKSFLAADLFCAVARGAIYAGRATVPGAVLYLTGEGVDGFKRRAIAMRQHLGIEGQGVPFFMMEDVPDLGSEATDLPSLLADLGAFVAAAGLKVPVRTIVLDTLARCMGEGDESSARDMGRFINRCGAIERHFGCLVAIIHHVGKVAERGGRGSNAQNGAADVTVMVEKFEGFSVARVHEMKDGREGQEWRFRLVPYDLSATFSDSCAPPSADLELSTCIVEILSEPGKAQLRATKTAKPPAGVAGDLLRIIRHAIEEAGTSTPDSPAVPSQTRAVTRENLKRYAKTMSWQDEREQNSWRAILSTNLSQLRAKGLIGFDTTWIWLQ